MSNRVKYKHVLDSKQVRRNAGDLLPKSMLRGCIGKMRHESERAAKRAIETRTDGAVQLFTYRCKHCKHCKGWHLTKQAPRFASAMPDADGFDYEEGV